MSDNLLYREAAEMLLDSLEMPIKGIPTVDIFCRKNAVQLISAFIDETLKQSSSERDSLRKRVEELEASLDQTNKSRSLELQRMNRLEVTIIDLQEELRSARMSFHSGNLIVNLPEKVDPLSPMHYVDGTPHEGESNV